MRQLCIKGNPVLKKKCLPVSLFDDYLHELVKDMRKVMLENKGCGLSAPQVGEPIRLIIVERQRRKGIWVVANPEIVKRSSSMSQMPEGCLSYPGIVKNVNRPTAIKVKGFTERGKPIEITAYDFEARIFCHEIDHLDGRCIIGT
jgi:peptide deformylase